MLGLNPSLILGIIILYFLILVLISYFTSRDSSNQSFFLANKQSPWYLVAFGMIGASLSGVTFISVPGWVGSTNLGYMQMVFGYFFGYLFIAFVLMPLYYRLNLTSIYAYLGERFGVVSHKTGAGFFLLSRTFGAAFRLLLVAIVLQRFVMSDFGVPFEVTVLVTILLIWIYTFRGGIKTIVITDTLQTLCMLVAVILAVIFLAGKLEWSLAEIPQRIQASGLGKVFHFDNWLTSGNVFHKRFLGGALIAIAMTGLDQDMMQKNLSCKSLKDAQKNMITFSTVLIVVNLLFLALGAMLFLAVPEFGWEVPEKTVRTLENGAWIQKSVADTDLLFPEIAINKLSSQYPIVGIAFVLGLIAAAYSSADSALTSLTTSFCVDFLGFERDEADKSKQKRTRIIVHAAFSVILFFIILIFGWVNDRAIIDQIFKVAGYTYGPLLGLFIFGLFTKLKVNDSLVVVVCLLSPLLTFLLDYFSGTLFFGYKFGFELLGINGLITFIGLIILTLGVDQREEEDLTSVS